MKRRKFIASAAAAGSLATAGMTPGFAQNGEDRQYLEWIRYTLFTGPRKNMVQDFYRDAAIPALNRIGISPVGVFSVVHGPNDPSLYVLIPHKSADSLFQYRARLEKDGEFREKGKAFLEAPFDSPAYARVESTVMLAFTHMPAVEAPKDLVGADHIVQVRIYESHNYRFGQKKIEMFNEGGEIAIFRKTGLTPVFFGETVIGPLMPNLTYMLAFRDIETMRSSWRTFGEHPDWKKLSADPQYKDTVSNITDYILRPLPFSQI
jgi:hypothetical protein